MTEPFRPNSVEFVSAELTNVVNSVPVTLVAKSARHNSHN